LSIAVISLLAVATSVAQGPLLTTTSSAKSLNDFGACFSRAQDQAARAWAFVPNPRGGYFTNAGANGVATPYVLRFSEGAGASSIQLVMADRARTGELMRAIEQCR
jgi:hypothetical protein